MRCVHCNAYFDDEDRIEICPICNQPIKKRLLKKDLSPFQMALINLLVFTLAFPVVLTFILDALHVSFLFVIMVLWIPALLIGIMTLMTYFEYNKLQKDSMIKNMIAALLSIIIIIFSLMMILYGAFDLYAIYHNSSIIQDDYGTYDRLVCDLDHETYYFEIEGDYYRYLANSNEYDQDVRYETVMETIIDKLEESDDGSYYIINKK